MTLLIHCEQRMAFHPPILVSLSVLLLLFATTGTALPKPWLPASAASQVPQSYQPSTFPPTQLLWPIPSGEVNYGIEDLSFSSPNFVVAVPSCDSQRAGRPGSQSGCAALEAAVIRYVNGSLFFPFVSEETTEVATSVSLTIEVEDVSTASFQLGTNESYCLSVSINGYSFSHAALHTYLPQERIHLHTGVQTFLLHSLSLSFSLPKKKKAATV